MSTKPSRQHTPSSAQISRFIFGCKTPTAYLVFQPPLFSFLTTKKPRSSSSGSHGNHPFPLLSFYLWRLRICPRVKLRSKTVTEMLQSANEKLVLGAWSCEAFQWRSIEVLQDVPSGMGAFQSQRAGETHSLKEIQEQASTFIFRNVCDDPGLCLSGLPVFCLSSPDSFEPSGWAWTAWNTGMQVLPRLDLLCGMNEIIKPPFCSRGLIIRTMHIEGICFNKMTSLLKSDDINFFLIFFYMQLSVTLGLETKTYNPLQLT